MIILQKYRENIGFIRNWSKLIFRVCVGSQSTTISIFTSQGKPYIRLFTQDTKALKVENWELLSFRSKKVRFNIQHEIYPIPRAKRLYHQTEIVGYNAHRCFYDRSCRTDLGNCDISFSNPDRLADINGYRRKQRRGRSTLSMSPRPCKYRLYSLICLLFYVSLKNFSLIWRRHNFRWRAAKYKRMLEGQGLWARRGLYRATPAVTRDLG
jgi:hypothetical protein